MSTAVVVGTGPNKLAAALTLAERGVALACEPGHLRQDGSAYPATVVVGLGASASGRGSRTNPYWPHREGDVGRGR